MDSMIITRAVCRAHDGKRDDAVSALHDLRVQTLSRGGAVFYAMHEDAPNGTIVTTEIYASSDDVLVHNSTENFEQFLNALSVSSIEVYGNPSAALVSAYSGWPVTYFPSV